MKLPNLQWEQELGGNVAGVDEVGRGPWAGPVVAAAVILPTRFDLPGINDSKKLSAVKRDQLYEVLITQTEWGVGEASVEEIDRMNILEASMLAMRRAVAALPVTPDHALIDGNRCPKGLPCPARPLVKGDAISLSIAAASIIAKVTRDRMMAELARTYAHYGWDRNAGYGTKAHQDGLASHGVTAHHRRSFKPIQAYLRMEEAA